MVLSQTLKSRLLDHHPARVTKADNDFAKTLDFKDKFSIQDQKYSQNWKKENHRH